jgi:hypothetical protein
VEYYTLDKIRIYPDFFAALTRIEMVFESDKNISVEVMDGDGKVMKNIFRGNVTANLTYNYEWDISEIEAGMYFLKIIGDRKTDFHKFKLNRKPAPSFSKA